jgi:formylglycine-generating enzyme required for sulfatase activity
VIRACLALCLFAAPAAAQAPRFVPIPPGDFSMAATEVTVRQFAAFVKATGYRTSAEREGASRTWKAPGFRTFGSQPVVYVGSEDAEAYCAWIGARLPTDTEWEHAARAGAQTRHYWGDAIDGRYLWYRSNSNGRPQAVGTKLPNSWGLHDMEGNVWEWAVSDPVKGERLVSRRGGSWVACENIEPAPGGQPGPLIGISKLYKIPAKYHHRYDDIGFRCARPTGRPSGRRPLRAAAPPGGDDPPGRAAPSN